MGLPPRYPQPLKNTKEIGIVSIDIFTVLCCLKNFPVDDLLASKSTRKFDGAAIVERLKSGVRYQKDERSFMTKTVCRYLMAHCQTYVLLDYCRWVSEICMRVAVSLVVADRLFSISLCSWPRCSEERGIATASRPSVFPSVCLSVMLMYRDHIGWKYSENNFTPD